MTGILPYDIQAESGIIATLIYKPEFILHTEYLKPEYFYIKENQCIYWAIQSLYKEDKVDIIDTFNLTTKLNSNAGVQNIINSLDLNNIQELVDLSKNVARDTIDEYKLLTNRVLALAFKRELYKKLQYFQNKALDEKEDNLGELSTLIYSQLNNLAEKYIINSEIKTFGEIVDELWEEICKRRTEDGVFGLPSKYPILSNYFTYEPQELVLLKARMKRGKSIFLMNEAVHKIKAGVPTAFFDTELSSRQFFERLLAHLTKISVRKIKRGNYTPSEEQQIADAIQWIKSKPFTHIYNPVWTLDQIYTHCKILQNKMNLQFLIYDYIKSNVTSSSEQYNLLGATADFLKNNIAGELKLPVLAAAQLNRKGETADSDKLDRYASVSVMWREKTPEELITDGEECGNFALTVNLNRLGEQMQEDEYLDFVFQGNIVNIEQAPKQHQKIEIDF